MKGTNLLKKTFTEEELTQMKEIAEGKDYSDFESFKEELLKNIREAEKEIAEGKFIPHDVFWKQFEEELRQDGCI